MQTHITCKTVLYTCMYTYVHTYIHTYIPTYIHTYMYTCYHVVLLLCVGSHSSGHNSSTLLLLYTSSIDKIIITIERYLDPAIMAVPSGYDTSDYLLPLVTNNVSTMGTYSLVREYTRTLVCALSCRAYTGRDRVQMLSHRGHPDPVLLRIVRRSSFSRCATIMCARAIQ